MRVLILSDIHGNWPAVQAVLATETRADRILCLGDLVNYGPQPAECVKWAMDQLQPEWLIQGNHDHAVGLDQDPHCSPPYELMAAATQQLSKRALNGKMKKFLAGLAPLRRIDLGGAKCVACHATPTNPLFHYLPEGSAPGLWESELAQAGHPEFLFVGHTHEPMKVQFQRTLVVNPGSVGQPKHGDPRAADAIWEDGKITLHRTPYDVEQTVKAYEGLGLEPHIVRSLCAVLRTGGDLRTDTLRKR